MLITAEFLLPLFALLSSVHISWSVNLVYSVEEGNSPDTYLGNIANDSHVMDSVPAEDHALITFNLFQLGEPTGQQLFRISKKSGKLYTAQTLDAESHCTYKKECFLMVDIAVRKAKTFIKLIEIKIIIQDVNDHQPEFPEKQINLKFDEDDRIGTKVSFPNAFDKDVGVKNSRIIYKLEKNQNQPFSLSVSKNVDGTSKLDLNLEKTLDRELKDSYMIQVMAVDEGSPPKHSILNIHITVSDVNDNPPVFSQNVYNVSIRNEPSKTIPIAVLLAKDSDSGDNSKIFYKFTSKTSSDVQTFFNLNEMTGEIFLIKMFTIGYESLFELYVKATDKGNPSLSSVAMVLVNIISQQNIAPTIDVNFVSTSSGNTVEISEDIGIGNFIAYVKVTDHDIGENGDVSCNLHHNKFQLQSFGTKKYQVIVKNLLDRESEDHHDVIITCQDKGSTPLMTESTFSVKVTDINDIPPQFSKKAFTFSIHENQKSRIPVGSINATDPDLGPGGKLIYLLQNNNKQFLPFKITDDGMISTIMSLDHEFQNIYQFQVFVKDKGTPSLNNTVNVIVKVRDENDNDPYFTFPSVNPYNMDVIYYPHHTKNITQIKASDSDSQENAFLKYEIIRGNSKQIFNINQYTGLLSSTHVLSQKDAGSFELEFLVKDSGSPVLSARTTVYLTLTISNKTSEMLNAVNIKTDNKIHLTSAIIIVSVAVTIAVIITASISVCILRCCNPRSIPVAEGRYVSGQRHLISPPYPANPWSDVSIPASNPESRRKQIASARESRTYSTNQLLTSTRSPQQQVFTQQMCFQDVSKHPALNKTAQKSQHFTENSSGSHQLLDRQKCGPGNMWLKEEMPDTYTSQYCNPPSTQNESTLNEGLEPLGQSLYYPSDTTIVARGFYTSYMNENLPTRERICPNSESEDNDVQIIHSQSMSGSTSSSQRPLPPVPCEDREKLAL